MGKQLISEGVCVLVFLSRCVFAAGVKSPGVGESRLVRAVCCVWEGAGSACPQRDLSRLTSSSPSAEATLDLGLGEPWAPQKSDLFGLPGLRLGHSLSQTPVKLCLSIASAQSGGNINCFAQEGFCFAGLLVSGVGLCVVR